MGIIKSNKKLINPRYLFYFSTDHFKKQLNDEKILQHKEGLYISDLRQLEVDYFEDLSCQKKISDFFTTLIEKLN